METQQNKHKYFKTLLTVFAGVLLIGTTAFGVWYWQQNELKKQKSDSDKQIQELQKQVDELKNNSSNKSSEEAADETADWKTFTDTTNGYSIKYPSNWVYKQWGKANSEVNDMVTFADKESNQPAPNTDQPAIIKVSVSDKQQRDTTCPEKIAYTTFTTKSGLTGNIETVPANSCPNMFGNVWKWEFASIQLKNNQYLSVTFVDGGNFEDIYNKMLETIEIK